MIVQVNFEGVYLKSLENNWAWAVFGVKMGTSIYLLHILYKVLSGVEDILVHSKRWPVITFLLILGKVPLTEIVLNRDLCGIFLFSCGWNCAVWALLKDLKKYYSLSLSHIASLRCIEVEFGKNVICCAAELGWKWTLQVLMNSAKVILPFNWTKCIEQI